MPDHDDDFEYTLCTILLTSGWADFSAGRQIAAAVKKARAKGIPTTFREMMAHPQRSEFLAAFEKEIQRYWDTGTIKSNWREIDWKTIDPDLIGDMMLIFDIIINPDGSLKKYKCRMVFRGDRCKNLSDHSRYASSVDTNALFLFLGIVACEDLDLWHMDVETAFLHNNWPPGMEQYVRRPSGVPDKYLPYQFQLGHCTYGHPFASAMWKEHLEGSLTSGGFLPIYSSGSVFHLPKTATADPVTSVWAIDGGLFATPFDSTMKKQTMDFMQTKYSMTIDDPASDFFGMHLVRDRSTRTFDITQPRFLDECEANYPLEFPDSPYPTSPMDYTKHLTPEDLANQKVILTPKEIKSLQQILGDCLWLTQHTRIDVKYPVNHFSRCVSPSPTLYDYQQTLRIMHYMIGTKTKARRIGGMHGAVLTATVEASFASHPDLKGQSCYIIHMVGGKYL
jgi:hypothetical protein